MIISKRNTFITLLVLFILVRFLFLWFPFWGLEYEDAFIYNDTGRFINYSYDFKSMPFKCQSCSDGSYVDCFEYGSYGGHFLTIPLILSYVNSIFGYHIVNIFFLNLIFSILLLCLVFYFYKRYDMKNMFSLNSFILFLSITPFLSIFNTSGLAETVSSFFVIGFLFSIYLLNEYDFKIRSSNFWLSIVFFILAIITKRENFVLLIFLCFIPFIRILYKQKTTPKSFYLLIGLSALLSLLFAYFIDLFGIENNESGDIGSKTFSLEFLLINLKQLFFAIINIQYWGITGLLFFVSIIFVIYTKQLKKIGFMALILTILYIIIYSSHYRSYYQVEYNLTSPFETLRYSTNYLPLVLLFISTILFQIKENNVSKFFKTMIGQTIFAIILITLILNSIFTRIEFSKDEYISRIQPVEEVLKISKNDDIIISNIPIIFRCYADDNQRVIDIFTLRNNRLSEIIRTNPNSNIYILKPHEMIIDSSRFDLTLDYTNFKKMEFSSIGFELLKYEKQ